MVNDDQDCLRLYTTVLERLRKSGVEELVRGIEVSVARGAVGPPPRGIGGSKELRSTSGREMLGVAIEHLLSALDVPVMFADVRKTTNSNEVRWLPASDKEISSHELADIDVGPLRHCLERIHFLRKGLKIWPPELP